MLCVWTLFSRSSGNSSSNSGTWCLNTFLAPSVRVGKRCRLFLFLVFLSCISWLYLKKDLKKLGKVLFLNLYQNFMHWRCQRSLIILTPWIEAQCGSYICCLSWYEQHVSAAWKFCSIQTPNTWYRIVAGIISKNHTWFLEQTVANNV